MKLTGYGTTQAGGRSAMAPAATAACACRIPARAEVRA